MPSVPDAKTPEPEKPATVKDLPPKQGKNDSASNVKGGVTGPCNSPRRQL